MALPLQTSRVLPIFFRQQHLFQSAASCYRLYLHWHRPFEIIKECDYWPAIVTQNFRYWRLQIKLHHSLSRYDDVEARQNSRLQNRRLDVELYLTVHKSFVSTSLNIIHCGCTFHLSYPYCMHGQLLHYTKIQSP